MKNYSLTVYFPKKEAQDRKLLLHFIRLLLAASLHRLCYHPVLPFWHFKVVNDISGSSSAGISNSPFLAHLDSFPKEPLHDLIDSLSVCDVEA